MRRSPALLAAGVLPLALLAAGCRSEPGTFRGAPVIIICVDTLRADRLPAWGYRGVDTPHLDRLSRDAIRFQNAYAHVPLTLASHATIFTGRLPPENGVRDNYGYALDAGPETMAALLKKGGYATGGAVSASVLDRSSGLDRGFDFYDDRMPKDRSERDGAQTAETLLSWIDSLGDRSFFAFLHVFEPHTPYEPPEPYRSRTRDPYDGEIARADEIVGEFLEALRRRKLYDRAIVLFLSDHGEGLGDHGEAEHGVFLYREAIHVPLLLKLPGSSRKGASVTAPVGLIDLLPSVALLSGIGSPPGLAGVPLTRYMEGAAIPSRRIYGETLYPKLRLGWSDLASLVDARYHYIEAPTPELYDLSADPGERRNLAAGRPPAFRAMRAELARMPRPVAQPGPSDPERARKLAALGYITATSPAAGRSDLPDPKDRVGELAETTRFQTLLAERRDAELAEVVRRFLERNPAALDVWRLLADALARQGNLAGAIDALERGLRGSSETTVPALRRLALERLCVLLVAAGRDSEALAIAEAEPPVDPKAWNAVGLARMRARQPAEARKAFERALGVDPSDATAHANLGRLLLEAGDAKGARARLEEAVRLDPRAAALWKVLGTARAALGDEAGAIACWRRALQIDASELGALFNLGIAAGRRGDFAEARRALELFVEKAPRGVYPRERAEARRMLRSLGAG